MKNKKDILKEKLKEVGNISLTLISKFKHERSDLEIYNKLIKINALAHEIHDSLDEHN